MQSRRCILEARPSPCYVGQPAAQLIRGDERAGCDDKAFACATPTA
jgi:hypothetical protein